MPAAEDASVYPVFLKLRGRDVLVVGAGPVAERKIASLLEAGAKVRVVAPAATEAVERWAREGRLAWAARPFVDADVEGARLVFASTSDAAMQKQVFEASEAVGVFWSRWTTRRTRQRTRARS